MKSHFYTQTAFIIRMKWMKWFFGLVFLFAMAGAFAKVMTTLNHNEHMYITAGVLVSQNKVLYRDFAFLQMPYLPYLYGGLYKLLGITSHYFLLGKLVSFSALILAALALFLMARRVLEDSTLAYGLAALFLLNMSIVNPAREVSNYVIPVFLSFLSVYLFEIAQRNPRRHLWLMVLCGMLLAFAVGVKLTYASIIFPFIAVLVLYPLFTKESFSAVMAYRCLPFVVGLGIGVLPAAILLIQDPELFVFNNWGYHRLNTQWRFQTGYTDTMTFSSKALFALEIFLKTENLFLLFGILFGGVLAIFNSRQTTRLSAGALLAFLLFIAGLISALAPTPSFFQYYAVPISFLFILLIYLWAAAANGTLWLRRTTLFVLVSLSLVLQGPSLLNTISSLRYRNNWSPLYTRDISLEIREVLQANHSRNVATLSPLYALEAGLSIYPELVSGPFLYRIGDLLTAEQRKHFVATSPSTIKHLLQTNPPAAILTGFEGELDRPLLEFALQNGYEEITLPDFEGMLYLDQR